MRRLSAIHCCALLLTASIAAAAPGARAEGEQETSDAGSEETEAADAEQPPEADSQRRRGGSRNGWWNDPKFVEALSLSEDQRGKADGFLEMYRDTVEGQNNESLATFHESLTKGEWAKAEVDLDELAAQAAVPTRSRGELKLNVLRLLSAEQLAQLNESFPRLITHPWVRAGRRGGPPRRGR